jgi:hypothetical protein
MPRFLGPCSELGPGDEGAFDRIDVGGENILGFSAMNNKDLFMRNDREACLRSLHRGSIERW